MARVDVALALTSPRAILRQCACGIKCNMPMKSSAVETFDQTVAPTQAGTSATCLCIKALYY